ncbi:TPA: hypothetical protein RG647_RS11470 [Providencia rettgeri]|uniref:hypothetical protein n=1 Tax=Providencia sp. PROV129 TaxID=2949839 RepID=UPI00234AF180|nr:hypothetical protein [Providencia sp. PROV129]HEC8328980.1 hypothetical protein [Providencia rettgeri]
MQVTGNQANKTIHSINNNNSPKGLSGNTRSVSNDNQKCPITTSEKTVHKKDLKQLSNAITKLLSDITSKFDDLKSGKASGAYTKGNISDFGKRLNVIQKQIDEYTGKLQSSSYKHHSSKPKTLNNASDQVKDVQKEIKKLVKQDSFDMTQTHQAYKDNNQRANDLLMGKKAPSKFEQ